MPKDGKQTRLPHDQSFDVVIVGGGINGISVYRELSLQGVKVLLVEKEDFCSKASGALSRMIHGGLRYLENGEFELVKESLAERNRLLVNAPHYVQPLVTTIPIFSRWSGLVYALFNFTGLMNKPSRRGALVVKLGLWFYDFFTRHDQKLPKHCFFSQHKTLARWPMFDASVKCSADYYDAWISSPERLALELLQDTQGGQQKSDSMACNYTELLARDGNRFSLRDCLSGETVQVSADKLVNATGAWIDKTNDRIGLQSGYLQGTKGSHIIVKHNELFTQLNGHMVFYENAEGRVCILFPYYDKVLIGSTDIPVSDPDSVTCTEGEINYMFDSLKAIFPSLVIHREDIVYQFSGVRPLPSVQTSTTGQIPRSHSLKVDDSEDGRVRTYSLIGGKWTTFRAFGEEVADQILSDMQRQRHISTAERAIGGGYNFPQTEADHQLFIQNLQLTFSLSEIQAQRMFQRYGTGCLAILTFMVQSEDCLCVSLSDYTQRELQYLIENEAVCKTLDLLQRRTSIAIQGRITQEVLLELTQLVAATLGWNEQQTKDDLANSCQLLRLHHGLDFNLEHIEKLRSATLSDTYVYQ